LEKKKKRIKPFCFEYDKVSECMVLKIYDKEGMFPLILKIHEIPECKPYKIILTKNKKLTMV